MTLLWIGKAPGEPGRRIVPGVAARDLSDDDLDRLVERRQRFRGTGDTRESVTTSLIASGLYAGVLPAPKPPRRRKKE